ncbi:hypothetical protein YC2023_076411 [Brassica napus]
MTHNLISNAKVNPNLNQMQKGNPSAHSLRGVSLNSAAGTSAQNTTPPPKPTLEPGVSNESSPNKRLTRQSLKNKN